MTVVPSIDPARFLHEQLSQASPDLLREMLTTFINALLSADADQVCGASYGTVSDDRTNRRNGYRRRDFDTRAGTLDVAIPKLRQGTYFPEWLLERRRRAEAALTTVVATSYLLGVSTRRMEDLVKTLGITGLSKSQVSEMAKDLDEQVEQFRTRPLDAGPYTFVAADALTMRVREGGRVVKVACLVATGVNADGYREILGLQVTSTEDGAGWLTFFRDLKARGLSGVKLVISDAHAGLVAAAGATLGGAWQRCRTHYAANLMSVTPKSSWPWVKTLLQTVFDQPDKESVDAQFDRVLDALEHKLPKSFEHLEAVVLVVRWRSFCGRSVAAEARGLAIAGSVSRPVDQSPKAPPLIRMNMPRPMRTTGNRMCSKRSRTSAIGRRLATNLASMTRTATRTRKTMQ